ncbi:GNAT family N-acetyltransferase [archaeon]|nr:MAG: GNAT family N-acetyltransferase [archaeon]
MSLQHVTFRAIQRSDKEQMIALHKEFFPVPYSMNYYDKLVEGIGMFNDPLYSVIAVNDQGDIVGFIFAQLLRYPDQCEDQNLFTHPEPATVCYILTLGCTQEYRRLGLGSTLLDHIKTYALSTGSCGCVYLHVIHYNTAAIQFYTKNQFEQIRYMDDFYFIEQKYFAAYLYVFYLPSYQPSLWHQWYKGFRYGYGYEYMGMWVYWYLVCDMCNMYEPYTPIKR